MKFAVKAWVGVLLCLLCNLSALAAPKGTPAPSAAAYNAASREREAWLLEGARHVDIDSALVSDELRAHLCGPATLYMSFPEIYKKYTFAEFVSELRRKAYFNGRATRFLLNESGPDVGMNDTDLAEALKQFVGTSERVSLAGDETELQARYDHMRDAINQGQVVLVTVNVPDVVPVTEYFARASVEGGHLVRVLGMRRDSTGKVNQVVIYDVNSGARAVTIPGAQFNAALRSWPTSTDTRTGKVDGFQFAIIMDKATIPAVPWPKGFH